MKNFVSSVLVLLLGMFVGAPFTTHGAATITLLGDNPMEVEQNSEYNEPGGTLIDPENPSASWSDVEQMGDTIDTSRPVGTNFTRVYRYIPESGVLADTVIATRAITIIASTVNQPPYFANTSVSLERREGNALDVRTVVHCFDPDGAGPNGLEYIDNSTYVVSGDATGITAETPPGTYDFTVGCLDAEGAAAFPSASVTIVVTEIERATSTGTSSREYTYDLGDGLVPCEGVGVKGCNACHLVQLGQNILLWLIIISVFLVGIIIAWAGLRMAMSAGNTSEVTAAKTMMTNGIIGIVILLAAWLVIDTVMKMFVDDSTVGPWNTIECVKQPTPYEDGEYRGEGGVEPTGDLVEYAGYRFDSAVVDNVRQVATDFNLRVTSGYRTPEHNARVGGSPTSHHLSGRAADFVGSAADMQAAAEWARNNGAIEVLIHNAGSGTHLHVAW